MVQWSKGPMLPGDLWLHVGCLCEVRAPREGAFFCERFQSVSWDFNWDFKWDFKWDFIVFSGILMGFSRDFKWDFIVFSGILMEFSRDFKGIS